MRTIITLSVFAILISCTQPDITTGINDAKDTAVVNFTDSSRSEAIIFSGEPQISSTEAQLEIRVPVVFRNISGDTLYIQNCNGALTPVLQKRVGDKWENYLMQAVNECLSKPIVLAPGQEYPYDLYLGESKEYLKGELKGEFRVLLHNVQTNDRAEAAEQFRVSEVIFFQQ